MEEERGESDERAGTHVPRRAVPVCLPLCRCSCLRGAYSLSGVCNIARVCVCMYVCMCVRVCEKKRGEEGGREGEEWGGEWVMRMKREQQIR